MEVNYSKLIQEILAGDETPFTILVHKFQKGIHALAWKKIGDYQIAEEITQALPWGIVATSTIIMMLLFGIGNQLISPYQNPYNVEAQSESSIEIVDAPRVQDILPQPKVQNRNGKNIQEGQNQNEGLSEEGEHMQNDSIDDTMQWNLPKDAIARFGKGGIRDILYSPDGSTLAVAGKIGLWLYDTSTYEAIDMIPSESTEFNCLAYSADGNFFAAGDMQGTIHLLNKKTGEKTEINAHTSWVNGLCFNPEGTILASAGRDFLLQLWDVKTGKHIKTLKETKSEIQCITFSPDGNTLASGENNVIRFFDIHSGNEKTLNAHSSWVDDLSYSPDGKSILSISDDNQIFLWDVNTHKKKIFDGPTEGYPTSVDFNPDGRIIASGGMDNKVHLWHGPTGEYITAFSGHTWYIVSVVFSPDGKSIASAAEDGTIRFWDVESGTLKNSLTGHTDTIYSVAFYPNGTQLISCNGDGTLNVWNIKSRSLVRNITSEYEELNRVVFNENGDIIACGIEEIVIINKDNPEQQRVLSKIKKGLRSFEITSDGKTYAAVHENKNIYLLNSKTGKLKNTLSGHTDYVYSTAFNPDNTLLASGSYDNTVRLWDVESGKEKMILTGHTKGVKTVTFSPDGKTLASGDGNKNIYLWDIKTGEIKMTLIGHSHWVFCLAYSPNGNILASAGIDKIINLWNPITGEKLKTLSGHTAWIRDIAFSPDGGILASTGDDGIVLLWEINYSELIP